MKKSQLRFTFLTASALSVSIASQLHAVATFNSNGAGGGNWSNPASWTAGVSFPDTYLGDTANINPGDTIDFTGGLSTPLTPIGSAFGLGTGSLAVAKGGAIVINNGTLDQSALTNEIRIGDGGAGAATGTGTLTIRNGGTFNSGTAFGVGVGSDLNLGGNGNGTVNIEDGLFFMGAGPGTPFPNAALGVGIEGSTGVINVGNGIGAADSATLNLQTNNNAMGIGVTNQLSGPAGNGTVIVNSDGIILQGRGEIVVGDDGGTGLLRVVGGTLGSGAGTTGELRIGSDGGIGTLVMTAGQINSAGEINVGRGASATGSVNITGGSLNVGDFKVGRGTGTGSVTLGATGSVSVSNVAGLNLGFEGGSNGTFTQSGGTLNLNGGHFQIGEGGTGTYNITAGTVSNVGWFHVGSGGGSVGVMNVGLSNPAGVVSGNQLYVGNNAATGTVTVTSGTLRIEDFGEVGRGGGTGTLNVAGPDARVVVAAAGGDPFFNVGVSNGHGTVNITGGGQFHTTNTWFTLGAGNGTTGDATVSGLGSKLTSKGLIVGWNGLTTGTLNISDNAVVENSARELSVGRDHNNTTGIINIDSGGTLNNTGTDAFVGHNGIGIMNMTGGAFNESNTTVFGAGPGSVGTLNLTGPGAVTALNFHVGRGGGVGHVVQTAGSVVSNSWSNIGDDAGPGGSDYKISGGSFTVASGGMELGRTRGGSMDISGTGTVSVAGELAIVGSHAGGDGALTLTGGGTMNVTTNNGLVLGYDGNSNGVFTQTGGTLNMNGKFFQIGGSGGAASGTYNITAGSVTNVGWFHVGSNAGSSGTMNVSFSNPADVISGNQLYLGNNNATGTVTVTSGTLRIDDVAEVGRYGGTGTLNVVGLNSRVIGGAAGGDPFFKVGREGGHGIVNITGGAQLHTTNTWFSLGENGSVGEATVSGVGSRLTSNGLIVGWNGSGSGTLNISDRAVVNNAGHELSVGRDNANTSGIINLSSNGTLNSIDPRIGHNGIGILNINGGNFNSTNGWSVVGDQPTANGTVNMTAGTFTTTGADPTVVLGANAGAKGTFNQTGGTTTIGNELNLGRGGAGSVGKLNLSGASTLMTVNGWTTVGRDGSGSGEINVSNGARFNHLPSSGDMLLGWNGGSTGKINVTSGGRMVYNWWFRAGIDPGSQGDVVVDGTGSNISLNTGRVYIGERGTGSLTVSNGGVFSQTSGDQFNVGGNDASANGEGLGTLSVTGAGSTVSTNNFLRVGFGNTGADPAVGVANVSNGGTISSGGWIGIGHDGGDGTLNMAGGTLTAASEFYVGIDDNGHTRTTTGTANITGGAVSAGTTIWIGRNGGIGVVNLTGAAVASLSSANEIKVGEGGVGSGGSQTTGTLNIDNPNALVRSVNGIYVGYNGGVGVVNHSAGSLVESNQWLTLAGGAGSTGSYNLSGGTVTSNFIEVGADGAGTFNVSGTGTVTANQFTVGTRATGVGVINVSTGGLVTNNGTIFLGGDQGAGSGTLNIVGGTVQTNSVTASLGAASLTLNGGTLRANVNEADFLRGFTNSGGHTPITLAGAGGTIDTNGKSIGITGGNEIAGTTLTKIGAGTLSISATQNYATLNHEAGRTNLNSALNNATINADGGTLVVNATLNNTVVNVDATNSTYFTADQKLASLNIANGGYVEVTDPPVPGAPVASEGGIDGGTNFDSSAGTVAGNVVAGLPVQGVPEPGSIALLFGGMLALLGVRRRQ